MEPLLRVSNVETAYYGRLTVLRGVSLAVPPGQIVAILGGNGAGKTTLLRTISGLIPGQPAKGQIEFDGRRITGWEPEEIARLGIGHVPEGRGLFPELTVEENLLLGGWIRPRTDRARWERVLALFPALADRRRQLAGTLSGGEQQMLAIARALLMQPRLLMLDEPSLGLAPLVVREVFVAIEAINRDGMTILLVEQNARMALEVAHYGYVLEGGRVVLEGPADDLRENPNVQELYLGISREESVKGYRRYKVRRRWA
ncbi:MAG: ABC transporter ATP-binding protein [Armatimonadota bacterium]|nr:ABC transporter ATP-binding protein [Armatimonadota bacterium]MDR7401651.1 ABC transporter ATP-binding protein [Armatimonadota bacterium]MDR7403593.1 ABC transporter ATP-binding protein [Armatimonadota bacterium]MDR7437795.1 ABC transporter ATP-binding protein [Armatimonadota bacterium]MDR7471281.1 ABC transporter ATP-binding protein [Armatimonadota bacterium]